MPLGALGYGCAACAYQLRSVGAILIGGGDPTNMVAWINSFDITTIEWGVYHQGNFTDPSQTSPPDTTDGTCTPGVCLPVNQLQIVAGPDDSGNCTIVDSAQPWAQRCQYYLPTPVPYYVIAYGTSISAAAPEDRDCGAGGDWFALGCIFPAGAAGNYPLIVDLPIPDNTLDDTILVQNYYLGIIVPGSSPPGTGILSEVMTYLPDLSSLTPSTAGVAGFGPNWAGSTGSACDGPIDDPFTGSDPP